MVKFTLTKYGIKENPVGCHITLTIKDKTYLGEVIACYYSPIKGNYFLKVKYFNGEMWPFDPRVMAVDVLEREYEAESAG